jgi:hypothetical protein
MDIMQSIQAARWLATDADIEALARAKQAGREYDSAASGTYFRVLIALSAHAIGGRTAHLSRRRGKHAHALRPEEVERHMAALETVHGRAYALIMRAVCTADIMKQDGLPAAEQSRRSIERNRRTNYARSALATIRAYVRAGRDMRDVDLLTVTKASMRAETLQFTAKTDDLSVPRLVKAATRAGDRIIAEAKELASIDPARAELLLDDLMTRLQDTLNRIHAGDIVIPPDMGVTTVIQQRTKAAA